MIQTLRFSASFQSIKSFNLPSKEVNLLLWGFKHPQLEENIVEVFLTVCLKMVFARKELIVSGSNFVLAGA